MIDRVYQLITFSNVSSLTLGWITKHLLPLQIRVVRNEDGVISNELIRWELFRTEICYIYT